MIPAPDFGSKFISSRKPRLHDVSDRSDVTLASFKAPLLICCQVNKRTGRWPCTKPFPEVASQPPFHKPAPGTYLSWRCCQDGKNTSRMLTAPLQLLGRSARFLLRIRNGKLALSDLRVQRIWQPSGNSRQYVGIIAYRQLLGPK